jgi:hypothetical protein
MCVNASKLPQVVADIDDGLLAAFSLFAHFRYIERVILYHITDKN